MDIREFILDNKLEIAVCIFLAFSFSIHMLKPSFVYNKDGSFREFGVGYLSLFHMGITKIGITKSLK